MIFSPRAAFLLLSLSATIPATAQRAAPPLVVSGVTVIPMVGPERIANATVVVEGGRISAVHQGNAPNLPGNAVRIDGRGKYLIPGLADMHAHLYADEWVPDSVGPYELGVYLAHGVTTARMMIGTPLHLQMLREINAGRMTGPALFIASPHVTGDGGKNSLQVRTVEEARQAVRFASDSGYDFVKLTTNITPEVFDALVDEARIRRIRLVGHVDPRVGVARALAAGQQIEHLDNYMESVLADSAPSRQSVSDYGVGRVANWQTLYHVDNAKVERIAGATARAGVFVTPTLGFFASVYATRYDSAGAAARPDFAHIPPNMRSLYQRALARFWSNPPTDELLSRYQAIRNRMVRAIVDSGGRIMAGSDGPGGLQGYGWMMHRELEALVGAGLTPHQALASATTVPAEFLGTSDQVGTVAVGKRADLVLLAGDPLADIRNTSRIEGVIVRGEWLDRSRLDAMIDAAGRRLNPGGFRSAADPESIIKAELAAIEKAWNDADLARHMAPYADSATMMGARGLIRGRATIHASMERSFWRDGKPLQQLRFEDIEVRLVGRGEAAAIVTGRFVLSGGDRAEASGRFTTVWELQDGRWVTVHDHSS